jgi:hypothetical protein
MRRSALFLFTRAALIALGLLVVLSAGSLALSRGDAYRCVVLYDGYTVAPVTYILDTATGHTVLDRREVQRLYSVDSPDGTARAGFVQRFGERATMTLLLDTPQGQRVVQTGIDASSQSNGFQQIAWARDGSAFAFMWRDLARRRFLTIADASGTIRQSIPYTRTVDSHPTLDPVTLAGWSGDSQYLIIAEFDGRRFYHHVYTAADLTPQPSPLSTVPVLTAELAPHGTQIAAISIDAVGAAHLVLADVSGARDLIDVPLQHDALSWRLAWSPTGAHIAVERISGCQTASCAEAGWHFELYTSAGTSAAPSLRGLGLGGSASGILPAQWQGDQWVWVERVDDESRYDLVRLDVPTGARTLLVPDLVPEYADDLFFVPPNTVWNSIFTNGAIFPMSAEPRAVVPFYDGELLGVDLVDVATGSRTALLRGVDMLAHTHFGSGSDFWWGGADSAWVSWIAPNGDAFLTVIDTRAGTFSTSPASRAVWRPQWIAADAIGFIDPRPDDYALMLFDTVAGTATPLIRVDPNTIAWRAALTADSGMVAAAAGGSDFIGKPLTLIDLVDASTQRVLSHQSAGTFVWSPDGARIAFAENSNRQANIAISDRLGSAVQRFTPPQFTTTPFIQFVAWTQC